MATAGKGTLAYFTVGQLSGTGTGHSYNGFAGVAFNPTPAGVPLIG